MNETKVVLLDLDNCISDDEWRIRHIDWTQSDPNDRYRVYHMLAPYDQPHTMWLYRLLDEMKIDTATTRFYVLTGRPVEFAEQTNAWLIKHVSFPISDMLMRPLLDHADSATLKAGYVRSLLRHGAFNREDVVLAVDDHPGIIDAYSEFGFPCATRSIHSVCAYTDPRGTPVGFPKKTVPELLRAGAATYEGRNKVYGDNYKHFGEMMAALFPDGLVLKDVPDWNRFGVYVMLAAKLSRYAASFASGGHLDSAHDSMVYSAMLEELTREIAQ